MAVRGCERMEYMSGEVNIIKEQKISPAQLFL